MKVKVFLSGGLRAILNDHPAELDMDISTPITIKEMLRRMNINPMLVMMVMLNGEKREKDFLITEEVEMTVVGPVAGG